jgi:hypothetical protein
MGNENTREIDESKFPFQNDPSDEIVPRHLPSEISFFRKFAGYETPIAIFFGRKSGYITIPDSSEIHKFADFLSAKPFRHTKREI